MKSQIHQLLNLLCGTYSNQEQAFENPPLYAHILIKYRPISQLEPYSLLLEQSYAIAPAQPYRLRVIRPGLCPNRGLIVSNFSIKESERFIGAIENPELRNSITADDLIDLKGCSYHVQQEQGSFTGTVEPGCRCIVRRDGRDSYLLSEFTLSKAGMQTIDRGYDPATHQHLWGSVAGPFHFHRIQDWSNELPPSWV